MNNQQFRRLLVDDSSTSGSGSAQTPSRKDGIGGATPSLGSRQRSSIPMTPRTVPGASHSASQLFARQMREQQAMGPPSAKRFRSSAAPKGTRLAAGYTDRTQMRTSVEEDDKAARIKALEEMVKLGQMEYTQFEALRDEIVGGDVASVHLVKGLDWKLLERVKRGEDVLNSSDADKSVGAGADEDEEEQLDEAQVEEGFDDLESKEVVPLVKEQKVKKGEMAAPQIPEGASKKRTRDDILRELKDSRLRAAAAAAEEEAKVKAAEALGPKFRKVGAQRLPQGSRIERDEKGREVLIVVDEHGNVKRKVRKTKPGADQDRSGNGAGAGAVNGLLMPDKDAKPLGMEAPAREFPAAPEKEDDGDIFEGVGADYDPFAGAGDDSGSDSADSGAEGNSAAKLRSREGEDRDEERKGRAPADRRSRSLSSRSRSSSSGNAASSPHSRAASPPASTKPGDAVKPATAPRRNYFASTSKEEQDDTTTPFDPLKDSSILSALKKASALATSASASNPGNEKSAALSEEAARAARHRKMLQSVDRDNDDLDLDFGSSRFGDQEDLEGDDERGGKGVKLDKWPGEEGENGKEGRGGGQRKRGPKKRRGDKNSAKDVLEAMEKRKKG